MAGSLSRLLSNSVSIAPGFSHRLDGSLHCDDINLFLSQPRVQMQLAGAYKIAKALGLAFPSEQRAAKRTAR